MNSLKATVIPQMMSAKRRAERLEKLGRISNIDAFLLRRKCDAMIAFLQDMEEEEVPYGETRSNQADVVSH